MTSEPLPRCGEGIRSVDLLSAIMKEWYRIKDGEQAHGTSLTEATVGLCFKKGVKKDKFCVDTLVLHQDEWTEAQSQAATCRSLTCDDTSTSHQL